MKNSRGVITRFTGRSAISGFFCITASGGFALAAGCFDIEVLNSKTENHVVRHEPDPGNHGYPIPFSRGAMQNTKYHEINNITVGVTNGHTQQRHHSKAQTGQDRMDQIQERCYKQEQELNRFGGATNHTSHNTGNQQPFNFMSIFRLGTVIHRQRSTWQTAEEGGHFALRQEASRTF